MLLLAFFLRSVSTIPQEVPPLPEISIADAPAASIFFATSLLIPQPVYFTITGFFILLHIFFNF